MGKGFELSCFNRKKKMASQEEIEDVFKVFSKKGKVEASQIGTLVRALGKNPLQKDVDSWIEELGGPSKSIDVSTVKKYYNKKLPKPRDQERDMREAFKVLDIQGKGFINEAELRQIMCTLGEPLTQEEFNLLMTKCEKDADGTIMYDNFVDMLISD